MENKNKTVIDSISETNQNVNVAKDEIIDFIRRENQNSNFRGGGFNWTSLFQTCNAIAIDRSDISTFKKRVTKTYIYLLIQMILSIASFIFASIFTKKASLSGIIIAFSVIPFCFAMVNTYKMKPALLTTRLVKFSPVYYQTFSGNVIRPRNRCSTSIIWYDILVCFSVFCDSGEIALVAHLDSNLELYLFLASFILFILQCVLSGVFGTSIKNSFKNFCIFYINGYVQNNGVQPIEAIIDPTDAQVIFSINEYNLRYPYYMNAFEDVKSEINLLLEKNSRK